jgi:hypothetical protein
VIKNFIRIIALLCLFQVNASAQGKISGLVYADYYYNVQRDTGFSSLRNTALSGNEDMNGFEMRRLYFTYDYSISPQFLTRIRFEADSKSLTSNNRIGLFVKDAYINWKNILPGHDLILGIQPTPAFEVSEMVYGFRSLEKTQLDLRGLVSSRDFGIAAKGRITGALKYWLFLANNSGNSPESDRYKRIYTHLNYIPYKNFTTTIYADLSFRQKTESPAGGDLLSRNVLTTALFFGYNNPKNFSMGVEGFYQNSGNDIVTPVNVRDRDAAGISVFGSLDVSEKLRLTGRYDIFDPDLNTDFQADKRHFYIFGLSYMPLEVVQIIPNLVVESYESEGSRSIQSSVTPRLTVTYTFF